MCNNEAMRIGRLKRVGFAFSPLQDLTPDHFQQWTGDKVRRACPSKVNHDLSLISAALNVAIKHGAGLIKTRYWVQTRHY
ncbi:MAG: hypothetical protein HRT36_00290 [Alphaproteobacteria bacterium]|nr:hypothetical protein [Alphaproteobacteria bacterium]